MKPLALDLCCGLGGWTSALLAEGWDVIGYDIERHDYGNGAYPGKLVLQDIRTLDGRQFRGKVSLIVCSPPCTEYSYMAMPWSRAKQIRAALLGRGEFPKGYKGSRTIEQLNELFNACIRIGQEAGCPIIIENVRGAQEWVGKARGNFGSFYLWGDVPALMPIPVKTRLTSRISSGPGNPGQSFQTAAVQKSEGYKGIKKRDEGYEYPERTFGWKAPPTSSRSKARKQASAEIAKIPPVLAQWIARTFKPKLR